MSNKGPNIPAGFAPPPPPPPGFGPPPPAAALKPVAPHERAWLTAPNGLNLNHLQHGGFYPDNETLLAKVSIMPAKAGKQIDDSGHKEIVINTLRSAITDYMEELWRIAEQDPELTSEIFKDLGKKLRNWKGGSNGLGEAYSFLSIQVPTLSHQLKQAQLQKSLESDPGYNKVKQSAQTFNMQFAALHEEYTDADDDQKMAIYEKMVELVQQMEKEKVNVVNMSKLRGNLRKAEAAVSAQKSKIAARTGEIKKEIGNLERSIKSFIGRQEYQASVKKNQTEIERLRSDLAPTQEEESNLNQLQEIAAKAQMEIDKANAVQNLFVPPEIWGELKEQLTQEKKPEKKKEHKVAAKEEDMTGMEVVMSGKMSLRALDIKFLNRAQKENLAFFLATNLIDLESYLEDDAKLAEGIQGALLAVKALNFNTLMDIAEGRMKRNIVDGEHQFPTQSSELLSPRLYNVNESVKPNYEQLLERSKKYKAEEYNKERGIKVVKSMSERAKFYDYKREIDLSFLDEQQISNLGGFFLDDREAQKEDVIKRVNDVLNRTNLSYEDIMGIASGNVIRPVIEAASDDQLLAQAQRNIPDDLEEQMMNQRQKYLVQQEREKSDAKKAAEAQKLLARKSYQAQAKEEIEKYVSEFKGELGIQRVDFKNLSQQFEMFKAYVEKKLESRELDDPTYKSVIGEELSSLSDTESEYDEVLSEEEKPSKMKEVPYKKVTIAAGIQQEVEQLAVPKTAMPLETELPEKGRRANVFVTSGLRHETRYAKQLERDEQREAQMKDQAKKEFTKQMSKAEKSPDPDPRFKPQQGWGQVLRDNDYPILEEIGKTFSYRASMASSMKSTLIEIDKLYSGKVEKIEILGVPFTREDLDKNKSIVDEHVEGFISLCQKEIQNERKEIPQLRKRVSHNVQTPTRRDAEIDRFIGVLTQKFTDVERLMDNTKLTISQEEEKQTKKKL